MDIPFFCVFLAFLLNYITKIPVVLAIVKHLGVYDNHHPRDQQAALTGFGKRAVGAHLNGFEIFPAFAAAVIMAHLANGDATRVSVLCVIFLISRIIYLGLYLLDKSTLRSLVWGAGVLCVILIFWQGII